ncbi:MAG: hypothetical protein V3S69_05660 [Dehalococcoidales bacterium]
MTDIKKAYKEVIELLEANKNKKVSAIMPQLLELVTAKVNTKTFKKDDEGNVTHIFCYYHKVWEDVTVAEYGAKKSSTTGLNTMCKEGVRQWSKQQRDAKKAKEQALEAIADGSLSSDDLAARLVEIEADRVVIVESAEA